MLGGPTAGNSDPMVVEKNASCANCGAALPASARFCPTCGVAAAATGGDTLRAQPVQEMEDPPQQAVRWEEPRAAWFAERRVFGAVPATTALVLASAFLIVALVVLVLGHLLLGLVLLAVGIAALALFLEGARRRPQGRLGQATETGMLRLREQASFLFGSADAWSKAGREVLRLRTELRWLERERQQTQYELGGATYAQNAERTSALMERLHALDAQADECVRASVAATARARERIARERSTIQPTEILASDGPDNASASAPSLKRLYSVRPWRGWSRSRPSRRRVWGLGCLLGGRRRSRR